MVQIFGASLKARNLTGPFAIHQQYRERLKQFYEFMLAELKQQQNLKQPNSYIEVDREKHRILKRLLSNRITGVKCWFLS